MKPVREIRQIDLIEVSVFDKRNNNHLYEFDKCRYVNDMAYEYDGDYKSGRYNDILSQHGSSQVITPICQDGGHEDCRGYVVFRESYAWMTARMDNEKAENKPHEERKMGKSICSCECHYDEYGNRKKSKS